MSIPCYNPTTWTQVEQDARNSCKEKCFPKEVLAFVTFGKEARPVALSQRTLFFLNLAVFVVAAAFFAIVASKCALPLATYLAFGGGTIGLLAAGTAIVVARKNQEIYTWDRLQEERELLDARQARLFQATVQKINTYLQKRHAKFTAMLKKEAAEKHYWRSKLGQLQQLNTKKES